MPTEDEIARATAKSRAWKARQAELEAAAREDEARAERRRAAIDRERRDNYQQGAYLGLVIAAGAVAAGLCLFEYQAINDRAVSCFNDIARPGHYDCADKIGRSMWFWLLPSETRKLIDVTRASGR
jgi:hypothetical protein